MDKNWDKIYKSGMQLNRYPYSEIVAFFFRKGFSTRKEFNVLDIGCGSGVHSFFSAENGGNVKAFDGSSQAIIAAKKNFYHENIDYTVDTFDSFDPDRMNFDLTFDRLSTSQSSPEVTKKFYSNLRKNLKLGARVFWQGFCWDNSGRIFGEEQKDGSWNNFSGGVFKPLGKTSFYTEESVREIFLGYEINSLRRVGDKEIKTGYDHSTWIVEASYGL